MPDVADDKSVVSPGLGNTLTWAEQNLRNCEARPTARPTGRLFRGLRFLQISLIVYVAGYASAQDVTTWHYDNARSGVQPNETILTPANVNYSTFGKVFSFPVVGDVYAQPLYLSQYPMSDGKLHNVIIIATAQDNVYAFDADGNNPSQGYLWHQSMLGSGETWVSYTDVNVTDIKPNIGITGTPVIDRAGGTIYLVAKSKTASGTIQFYQRLHALNIADGTEKLNGPTKIAATVPGLGDSGTTVSFSPLLNNQRPALLLAPTPGVGSENSIFIGFASHGDLGHYHGWFMAYDAANIANQNGAWAVTPNGNDGGIWMSGGGPSSDSNGNIFTGTGNGTFDANTNGPDYGDSAVHLTLSKSGLAVADYFTPGDQLRLSNLDNDMGISAVTLLPVQGGSLPHLAVTADKSGTIYLLNLDNMDRYITPGDSSVQDFADSGFTIHNSFAFFNNKLYLGVDGGPMEAWTFNPQTELFATTPTKSSGTYGCNGCSGAGGTPSVSANGTNNGIVWMIQNSAYYNGPAILHAFLASNVATELYNSSQAANGRDAAGQATKFTTPTIANGRVYIGGRNAVTVYGLLSTTAPLTATPVFSPPQGTYTSTQTVKITDSTSNASIYYTTDGDPATTESTLYSGPIQVSASETIEAVAIAPGMSQSGNASATYTINPSTAPTQTQVSLAASANTIGIFTDGTKVNSSGINSSGNAYSATHLGKSLTYGGITYDFGTPNQNDVVRGSKVITLPAGKYSSLKILGLAVTANTRSLTFTVTYTDGTTSKFVQSVSDWITPQKYAGESIALITPYRDTNSGGHDSQSCDLYQYTFTLNSAKTVKSLTMPSSSNAVLVAATLLTGN
jgi:hypothetical protein